MRVVDRVREVLGLPPGTRRRAAGVPAAPRAVVRLRGAVPGALVRLAPLALLGLAVALTGVGWAWWVVLPLGLAAALRPDLPFVPAAVLVLGLAVYQRGDMAGLDAASSGGLLGLGVLVAAVHLALRTWGIAQHVAWTSLVEVGVLARALRSVVAVQLVVQPLVLGTVWARANLGGWLGGAGWLRVVALVAVVAAVVVLVPRDWLRAERPPRRD